MKNRKNTNKKNSKRIRKKWNTQIARRNVSQLCKRWSASLLIFLFNLIILLIKSIELIEFIAFFSCFLFSFECQGNFNERQKWYEQLFCHYCIGKGKVSNIDQRKSSTKRWMARRMWIVCKLTLLLLYDVLVFIELNANFDLTFELIISERFRSVVTVLNWF